MCDDSVDMDEEEDGELFVPIAAAEDTTHSHGLPDPTLFPFVGHMDVADVKGAGTPGEKPFI